MNKEKNWNWPSGDCRAVLATMRAPANLVGGTAITTFRDQDDLDWFEGANLRVDGLGRVLIMKHDNNPKDLTAFYVDCSIEVSFAEECLMRHFELSDNDVIWRLSSE